MLVPNISQPPKNSHRSLLNKSKPLNNKTGSGYQKWVVGSGYRKREVVAPALHIE